MPRKKGRPKLFLCREFSEETCYLLPTFLLPPFPLSEIAFACSSCSRPFLVRFSCSAVNVRWIVKFQHYIIVSLRGEFRFCTLNVDANDSFTVRKNCFDLYKFDFNNFNNFCNVYLPLKKYTNFLEFSVNYKITCVKFIHSDVIYILHYKLDKIRKFWIYYLLLEIIRKCYNYIYISKKDFY